MSSLASSPAWHAHEVALSLRPKEVLDPMVLSFWRSRSPARRTGVALSAVALLVVVQAADTPTRASELRLSTVNDSTLNGPDSDDLYTAALELDFALDRNTLHFSEKLFTDKAGQVRWDETFAGIGRNLELPGRWAGHLDLGVLQIGKGLFGERAQNATHRLLEIEEVALEYLDSTRWHPTARLRARREWLDTRSLSLDQTFELATAIGFRDRTALGLALAWTAAPWMRSEIELSGRINKTHFAPLAPYIETFGLSWEVRLHLLERLSLAWNYNEFDTRAQHLRLDIHWSISKKNPRDRVD